MIQKILRVGNSYAITIPHSFAKEAKIKAGQTVIVEEDTTSHTLTVQLEKKQVARDDSLTPEFLSWLKKFNSRYKNALTELSNK